MSMTPSTLKRPVFLLIAMLLAWALSACGGISTLDTSTAAGGAAGASSGGATGKGGAGAVSGGTSGSGGTTGVAGASAGKAGSTAIGGAAGTSASGGAGGSTTAGGAAGVGGGAAGAAGATTVISVTVAPAQSTLSIGTSVALTATALSSNGTKSDVTALATWTASSPVVAVKGDVVTAVSAGAATVTATYSGKSGTAAITVSTATATKLTVSPSMLSLAPSGTGQLTATLSLSDGSSQDVTKTASWTSASPSIASAGVTGLVTAKTTGDTTVTASAAGLTASAPVHVSAATLTAIAVSPVNATVVVGATQQLTATGTFSDGTVGDVTTSVAWTSSDATTFPVDVGGLGTALAQGTSIVTASLSGVSGATTVTVTSSKIVSIAVAPASASLAIGGTLQLTATATFASGATADVTAAATWTSSATAIATASSGAGTSGLINGVSAGAATITATLGATSGTAAIKVISGTLTSLAITPAAPTVPLGASQKLTATGTYSDGTTIDATTNVTWSSANPATATVSNAPSPGLVTGVALGSTTITVSLSGITATATVTVSNAALASIVVSPATSSLATGKKESLTATGVFSDGTMIDVTQQAVWSSSAATIATVSNVSGVRGQVDALAVGDATMTATYLGESGTATVTVTQPTVSQLVISPTNATRPVGQQQQFQATAIFDNGTQQNVTMQTSWTSSDPTIAPINAMGRVAATAAGTVTITATWNGLSVSTSFTVSGAVAQSIAVSPINPTLAVGTVTPFSATVIYSDGTSQGIGGPGGGCTWTSSKTATATVSTGGGGPGGGMGGQVTAVAAGTADITCSAMGLSGSSTVTVVDVVAQQIVISPASFAGAVGATQQFTAQVIYSDGTSMDVTQQATWQSDKPGVATVTTGGGGPMGGARGQGTAVSPGNATISATYKGLTGTATFMVTSATLTGIVLSPPDATSPIGVKVKLTATAVYDDGSSMDVTNSATWVSSNASVAGVGNSVMGGQKGLVTPIATGTVTITATALGKMGTTSFTVSSSTLMAIQVTPFSPTLPIGYATPFQATGIYSDNSTLDLTTQATWQSTAPAIASVSDGGGTKGRVSPNGAGTADIQATYMGVTGVTTVTVTAATLQSIAIAPDAGSVTVGQTLQYTATGDFGGGLLLDITAYVTWASSSAQVAAISNATASRGQAKGLSKGTTSISAIKGMVSASVPLTVD